VDRKSRLVKIEKVNRPSAKHVHKATVRALDGLSVRSLTNDNGCEFIRYQETAEALGVPVYFTRPYASWERGTIENTNKLIRQYIPKKHISFFPAFFDRNLQAMKGDYHYVPQRPNL